MVLIHIASQVSFYLLPTLKEPKLEIIAVDLWVWFMQNDWKSFNQWTLTQKKSFGFIFLKKERELMNKSTCIYVMIK